MATTGVHEVVFALREHGEDMERAMADEVAMLAQMATRTMRRLAAKGPGSGLVNSIKADQVDPLTWHIGPHVAHAVFVEDGIKPGGKGLPRFFDPAAKSIVDWLQKTAFAGQHKASMASRALQRSELALRDRYEGLAWHVKHKGVKAQPFVEPTAREMEPLVFSRLDQAARRVLAARPDAGAAA